MGLQVGVAIELMFLAVIFVGTAIPPDEVISAGVATALACLAGSAEVGIATALPIALIGQIFRQTRNATIHEWTMKHVEKAAVKANPRGIVLWTSVIPGLIQYIMFGIPTFVAVYFGAGYVQAFIDFMPEWLVLGISAGGGLIGAVGVALLLGTVKDKTAWPYFAIGFFFAAYLGINMIAVACIAAICVALNYYRDTWEIKQHEMEDYVIEEDSPAVYEKLTQKDLWKTFRYSLAIESGCSTTKQEAAGIAQGMIPVIEKVYDSKEDKSEAYKRHTQLFLTEGRMAALCIGIATAMEERYAKKRDIDPESINAVKVALMGPLATAGMLMRYFGIFKGYASGLSLVSKMQQGGILDKLTKYAGIAAFTVCGGFISKLVYVKFNISYSAGDSIIELQKVLDGLMPNLAPLLFTGLIYWLIEKKKVNIILLMFLTLALGVILVYWGVIIK